MRITADDLGMSLGVDEAIVTGAKYGSLTHASMFATTPRLAASAAYILKEAPELNVGLHFNLTSGKALCPPGQIALLTTSSGIFRRGFVGLMVLAVFRKNSLLPQVGLELEAQLLALKRAGMNVSHIDGHRHVHLIFGITDLVKKAASKHQISEIRIINERFWQSLKIGRDLSFMWNGNLLKFILLRILSKMSGIKTKRRFFSILYSCRITPAMLARIDAAPFGDAMEVMLHPALPKMSGQDEMPELAACDRNHLQSAWRVVETNAMLRSKP